MHWNDLFMRIIKQFLVRAYYKMKYPSIKIDSRALLGKNNKFGEGVRLYEGVRIANTKIGRYSYVASFSRISNAEIGAFCSIGPDVLIGLGIHPTNTIVSTHPSFYSVHGQSTITFSKMNYFQESKRIIIGNDVWIGARVIILDGVKIGNGVIIGAGSIVTKDLPDYSIAVGVPAKIIKYRFDDQQISELLNIKWWEWDIKLIEKNANLFLNINDFLKGK